jgi:hypothetical protein
MSTYTQARAFLITSDEDRIALGFDTSRPRGRVGRNLHDLKPEKDVPSVVTVWRHTQRFGSEKHACAYKELFERLADEPIEKQAIAQRHPWLR